MTGIDDGDEPTTQLIKRTLAGAGHTKEGTR